MSGSSSHSLHFEGGFNPADQRGTVVGASFGGQFGPLPGDVMVDGGRALLIDSQNSVFDLDSAYVSSKLNSLKSKSEALCLWGMSYANGVGSASPGLA